MASLGFCKKSVLVYGLGKSGLATAEALLDDGAVVYVFDKSGQGKFLNQERGNAVLHQSTFVDDIAGFDFSQLSAVFKSPGIAMDDDVILRAVGCDVPVLGDVDLLYKRELGATFIGITGTNGKSTVTSLVGYILKVAGLNAAVGGNLGTPCLDLPQNAGFYVLELSSYQLELLHKARLNRAVILNLTPDHLARHGDLTGYLSAKLRIFNNQQAGDVSIVCTDSSDLADIPCGLAVSTMHASDVYVNADGLLFDGDDVVMDLSTVYQLPGQHNWQNCACAYALVKDYVCVADFVKAVETFAPLAHRMQKFAEQGDVVFYNDSKATNADATIPALSAVENIYWIAGGQAKDEGVVPCIPHLENVKKAYLIGAAAQDFATVLAPHVPVVICGTLAQAVSHIFDDVTMADKANVLLSPACASWDQFESFEARGDAFMDLVLKHLKEVKA